MMIEVGAEDSVDEKEKEHYISSSWLPTIFVHCFSFYSFINRVSSLYSMIKGENVIVTLIRELRASDY